jgi:DNA-binding transcriptional regulator GbsR (MarR family)
MVTLRKKQRFVDLVERIMVRWGYTHTDGKIYGILSISERALTIDQLAEETGLSRSSVSTSLTKLSKDYFVTVKKKGRVKYFSPVPSFLEKFLDQPKELLEKEIIPLKEITEKMVKKAEDEHYRAKLEEMLKDLETLECVLNKIIRMEEENTGCLKE